jgi:hypothetical protein
MEWDDGMLHQIVSTSCLSHPRFGGGYVLRQRIRPLRLQILAFLRIKRRVVTWRPNGRRSHQFPTNGAVQLVPCGSRRPACVAGQAFAVLRSGSSNNRRSSGEIELHD